MRNQRRTRSRHAPAPTAATHTMRASTALAMGSTLLLTACAGGVGAGGSAAGDSATGFDYGAAQDDVDAAIDGLDPVTLTYQPPALSADTLLGPIGTDVKDEIERRSNGQITVDVVWAQSIAGYAEVHDALADGRVDLAYTLPIYEPAEFPVFDSTLPASAALPSSPIMADLIAFGVYNEIGWDSAGVEAEFSDRGLSPIMPMSVNAASYIACSEPLGEDPDLAGKQVAIGSTTHAAQITALGGTPVSIEHTERFEALQRGTVDCSLLTPAVLVETGILEVAPHLHYMTDSGFARTSGSFVGGTGYSALPLPYQQIIFDSVAVAGGAAVLQGFADGTAGMIGASHENGGENVEFSADSQTEIRDAAVALSDQARDEGLTTADYSRIVPELSDKWAGRAESLGYEDGGDITTVDDWYSGDVDYSDFSRAVYEDGSAMEHRPH